MASIRIPGYDDQGNELDRIVDEGNVKALIAKARTALVGNVAYLGHAAVPAGTLTTAQLSAIVRILSDQVDALTRQNDALIRLLLGTIDDISDT